MRNTEEIIREILAKRDIVETGAIEEFLSEKPKETYDPFLLDGIQEGVDLLISEIDKGGKICIYGDYDADGVTSTSVMIAGISKLTDNWFYYIPSRFTEGYGLNNTAIDEIKKQGATLIITVDCGCVSFDEVSFAKSIGLNVIVTDHHNIEDRIAPGIVIDPKKPKKFLPEGKEPYPCKDLAGCGVAFKFLQALQRTTDLPRSVLNEALDMVAIGTVADIVSLRGENRTLVKYGIKEANSGRRTSLKELAKAISLDTINSENIAFAIAPHVNATGRIKSARIAVELFNSKEGNEIQGLVKELVSCNAQRKSIQEKAYEECLKYINEDDDFIVLKMEDIHEGIAGIVAGKIKDKYNRPVIITTPTPEGDLKGTGRSTPKLDIYKMLNDNNELFKRFGGHKSACGFLMESKNYEALKENLLEQTRILLEKDDELFEKILDIDLELKVGEASVELAKSLGKLAPFGEGNPAPKFLLRDVRFSNLSYMGEAKTHARFVASKTEDGNCNYVNCVLFRKAQEKASELEGGNIFDLVGSLNYQIWRGQERVQFIVEEIINAN